MMMENYSNNQQSDFTEIGDFPVIIGNQISRIIAVTLAILNSIWIIPVWIFLINETVGKFYMLRVHREYFFSRLSTMFATTHGIYYFLTEHLLPYLIFIIGSLLLLGYIFRAFDKLSKRLQLVLWITQILGSLPILYLMLSIFLGRGFVDVFDYLITMYGILMCILPSIALIKDILVNRHQILF